MDGKNFRWHAIEGRDPVPKKKTQVYCFECANVIQISFEYNCAMDRELIAGVPNTCKLARSDEGLCGPHGYLYEPK